MKKDSRDYVIDCMKALAIILMVIGHSIQLFNGEVYRIEKTFYDNTLYKVIYSFHMPFFMLISGYLYYFSEKKYIHSLKNNIFKISQYLIPIFTFASIRTVWNTFTNCKSVNYNIFTFLTEELYNIFHVLWYLWAIIYSIIIIETMCIINNKINDKYKKLVLCILSILVLGLFFLSPDILMGNVYKFIIPYFGIGYELNRRHFFRKMEARKKYLFVLFLMWVFLIFLYKRKHYIYVSGFSLMNSEYGMMEQFKIDIFRWGVGLAGALSIWGYFQLFFSMRHIKINNSAVRVMSYIGRDTLIIYSFSTEIFNEIVAKLTYKCSFSYIRTFVLSFGIIITCLYISYILKRPFLSPLKKVLTGRV